MFPPIKLTYQHMPKADECHSASVSPGATIFLVVYATAKPEMKADEASP
jgi:hypothetical protein